MSRVLGRVRLSRSSDESTSEARQREAIEHWAKAHGHVVVGWAVDIDVSGSIDPFETPELGVWLKERFHEWDILCAYHLDRIARRIINLHRIFEWIKQNEKQLATISDKVDLSDWRDLMLATVIAGVAEGELQAISQRNLSSQDKLRRMGRWHGGTVPIGYQTKKRDDGWYLEVDPGRAEIVREICNRVLGHEPIQAIADDLNERGIPSPRKARWTRLAIARILRSRWLIGQLSHKPEKERKEEDQKGIPQNKRAPAKVVTDDNGIPVQFAEPLVSFQHWQELQSILDNRSRPKNRTNGQGLLTGIAYCLACGEPLYHNVTVKRGVTYRSWLCSGRYKRKNGCDITSIPAETLESSIEEALLTEVGDVERKKRVFVEGESYGDELAQVEEAISSARKEKDLGLYEGDEDSYLNRMSKLVERRNILKDRPERAAGWQWQGLGENYRQAWQRLGTFERRSLLLDSGISLQARMIGKNAPEVHLHIPMKILQEKFPGYEEQVPTIQIADGKAYDAKTGEEITYTSE